MDRHNPHKVGIVTVTYNSSGVLPDFFRSVWRQTHSNFILYAIDSTSTDTTLAQLEAQKDDRLRINLNAFNVGIAEGNNIGIRMALRDECDAVLLLNNDVVFPPDLIATLVESQHVNQSDMVGPKMMWYEPSDKIWWAGGYFQPALGYRAVHRGLNEVDIGRYNKAIQVAFCPACCVLIKSDVFAKIGMMDPKYFVYGDDTDFMLRSHKAHLVLLYEPGALLYHKVSSLTGGTDSPFMVHLLARNRVYFWVKHLGVSLACLYTAGLGAIYVIKYLLRSKSRSTLKIQLNAMLDGFRLA